MNKSTLEKGLAAVRLVREHAAKIGDFSGSSDAAGLAALAIAYTRDLPIEAVCESKQPFVVSYTKERRLSITGSSVRNATAT